MFKKLFFLLPFIALCLSLSAQKYPFDFPVDTTISGSENIHWQNKSGGTYTSYNLPFPHVKKYMSPNVVTSAISFVPDTASTARKYAYLGKFVTDPHGNVWYISGSGTALDLGDPAVSDGNATFTLVGTTLTITDGVGSLGVSFTGWDTDASNDLTTATTFAGDVGGAWNNLQLGAGSVGGTELATGAVALNSSDVTGTLGAGNGGTGLPTFAAGSLLYGSAANTWSALAPSTNGFVLTMVGGAPAWAAPSGSITGSGTANYIARWTSSSVLGIGKLYDNGTNVLINTTSPIVSNIALQSNSTASAPFVNAALTNGSGATLFMSPVVIGVGSYIYNNSYYNSSLQHIPTANHSSGIFFDGSGGFYVTTDAGLTPGTAYLPTTRFQVFPDGRVRIGSGISLLEHFNVGGGMALNGILRVLDGSAASPSLTFINETDVGMFRPATNRLGFSTGGIARMEIGPNGEVYFNNQAGSNGALLQSAGTSGPPTWVTGSLLPVGTNGQTLRHNGTSWVASGVLTNDGTNPSATAPMRFSVGSAALPAITPTGDPDNGIWFPTADAQAWSTSGLERMRLIGSLFSTSNLTQWDITASTQWSLFVGGQGLYGVSNAITAQTSDFIIVNPLGTGTAAAGLSVYEDNDNPTPQRVRITTPTITSDFDQTLTPASGEIGVWIKTGATTLDFPSTAANSYSELTITLTGAVVGKPCVVGYSNTAHGVFVAYCSTPGQSVVRFINTSTGAIDPVSSSFDVHQKL